MNNDMIKNNKAVNVFFSHGFDINQAPGKASEPRKISKHIYQEMPRRKHGRIKVFAEKCRTLRICKSDYEVMRKECERRQIPLIDLQHELCESLDKKSEKR